jgi:hypothetical protein
MVGLYVSQNSGRQAEGELVRENKLRKMQADSNNKGTSLFLDRLWAQVQNED